MSRDQDVYDWLFSRTRHNRERGSAPARALLDRLGRPETHFASLRVVGTNGKGSVCAMLEAGLLAAGVRTGLFTSPHLTQFEERIRVGGVEISPERTARFVGWARRHAQGAAFFDLSLGLAAQVFAEAGVTLAVMEAGVGGASDATQALNVRAEKGGAAGDSSAGDGSAGVQAVLLTNVALDHTATLGGTVAQIAEDKARAASPGVPLLTTAVGEALEVASAICAELGAPIYTPPSHPALFALPRPPRLAGPHQERNASLALATLRLLGHDSGTEAALDAFWPARLQRFTCAGRTVLLDGAHNPAAARALAQAAPHADVLLFGNLPRKDSTATLQELLGVAPLRVLTHPSQESPHADLETLAARFGGLTEPDAALAFRRALALTPLSGTLLVAGSLYLAGTLLRGALAECAQV